jgi:hypothetical protein
MGQCAGMCVPNTTQLCGNATTCNASATQTCDATGVWGPCKPDPSPCVAVPSTWQPVAIVPMSASDAGPIDAGTVNCPDGFASPQAYYTSAQADDFTCTCKCGGLQSCSGSVTLNEFEGSGDCSSTPTSGTIAVSAVCTTGAFGVIKNGYGYTISDIAYDPAPACSATALPSAQPKVTTETAVVCTAASTCPSGACLSPSQAMSLCVGQSGDQTCPTDYPTRTLLSSTIDDTRGCGSCECGSTLACSLTGVLLDNAAGCTTGHPYWMTATDTCAAAPSDFPLNAVKAIGTSTGSGVCAMTSPSDPTGTVELNQQTLMTVCCK